MPTEAPPARHLRRVEPDRETDLLYITSRLQRIGERVPAHRWAEWMLLVDSVLDGCVLWADRSVDGPPSVRMLLIEPTQAVSSAPTKRRGR